MKMKPSLFVVLGVITGYLLGQLDSYINNMWVEICIWISVLVLVYHIVDMKYKVSKK